MELGTDTAVLGMEAEDWFLPSSSGGKLLAGVFPNARLMRLTVAEIPAPDAGSLDFLFLPEISGPPELTLDLDSSLTDFDGIAPATAF